MTSKFYIALVYFFLFFLGTTNLYAQEEEYEDNHWVVKWLFGKSREQEDNHENNVYKNLDLTVDLNKLWKFNIGDRQAWSSPNYDDSGWEYIRVPSDWENEGFNGYDGYAWYRIHIDGSQLDRKQTYSLLLGFVDDVDQAYFNGELIGQSGSFPPRYKTAYESNRKYPIPTSAINFGGNNVIAVRVLDEALNGGIISGNVGIYRSIYNEKLAQQLYGKWKFTKRDREEYNSVNLNDDYWETLLVPSFWDNQGHRSLDGVAWYRKTFELDFALDPNKTYYLSLGKIDDFDATYLNGKFVGSTNDTQRFGESGSFDRLRYYKIPRGLLNQRGKNVIAVRVIDIGYNGGMYEGSIGIMEEADVPMNFQK